MVVAKGQEPGSVVPGVSPVLVGRVSELDRLEAALKRVGDGRPAVVFLAGEAGAGKSRLVAELMRRSSPAALFLVGGCIPLGSGELPFAPVLEAFRGLDPAVLHEVAGSDARALARLLPEVSERGDAAADDSATEGQSAFFDLFLGLLGRLSRSQPVVLVLEDLHWADRSTLEVIAFLVRNLRRERVAVLATYRHDEIHRDHPMRPWLVELRRADMVDSLELRRLDREDTAEQLAAILGSAPSPAVVDAIYERGEGNPFFSEELLGAVTASGFSEFPGTLLDVPLTKVHALSEPAQELLRVAAAAGRRASHELLATIAGVEEGVLNRGLREALDHQVILLDPDGETYSFRHGLIQEAVYGELLPGERRRLHAALAQALTDAPELSPRGAANAVAEVAHHWHAARDWPRALEAAVAAATVAHDLFAYAEAMGHLTRAITLWPRVPAAAEVAGADLITLHERAGDMAGLIGEYETAVDLVRGALELVDHETDTERAGLLYEQLGNYLLSDGEEALASQAFKQAVAMLPVFPPRRARGCALISAGQLAMLCSRYGEAEALANEALSVAREVGDGSTEARSLGTLAVVAAHRGRTDEGAELMRRSIAVAQEADDAVRLASLYINFGHVLGLASRLDEAIETSVEGYEVTRRLGLGRQAGSYLKCNAAWALFKLGRWQEAGHLWREAAAGGLRGIREVSLLLACAELDIAQGRFALAHQRLDRALLLSRRGWAPLFYQRELAEQRAELAVWEGDLEAARGAVAEGLELVGGTDDERFGGKLILLGLRAEGDGSRSGGGRGRARPAVPHRVAELLDLADRFKPSPFDRDACGLPEAGALGASFAAERARCTTGAASDGGADLWAVAARRWDELRRPYPAAYCRWREGEAWLAQGERARAVGALEAAVAVARALDASPLLTAIEEVSRRARMRVGKSEDSSEQPAWAAAGLTRREAEVLSLVAAGHTNAAIAEALFISQSTAGVHVSRILTKLGVTNRGQAAAAARRLNLTS